MLPPTPPNFRFDEWFTESFGETEIRHPSPTLRGEGKIRPFRRRSPFPTGGGRESDLWSPGWGGRMPDNLFVHPLYQVACQSATRYSLERRSFRWQN